MEFLLYLCLIFMSFLLFVADIFAATWRVETIDIAGNVGEYASIAVDSKDNIHISYNDGTNDDLKYATNATGIWTTKTVDSIGDMGWYTSLAIDSTGTAHIGYYDYSNDNPKYANNATGTWTTETIDKNGIEGRDNSSTSIAVDSKNRVHISYYDYINGDLKYATALLSGRMFGSVVDKQSNPLQDVQGKLKGKRTKIKKETSSDASGYFAFEGLEKDT